MLYYFKKGKNATEMQKRICAVYGENVVTDWNVSEVVCEVCWYYGYLAMKFFAVGLSYNIGRCLAAPLASTH